MLLGGEKLARAEHHSSVQELIASEKAAREAHAEELTDRFESYHGKAVDSLDFEKEARAKHHALVEERVSCLEQLLNDSADRHESLKDQHSSIREQIEAFQKEL